MKLKLDVLKNADGTNMLHVHFDVVGEEVAKFVVPLGADLLYAFYKGLMLDLNHLDCVLNDYGKEAKAKALAVAELDSGKPEAANGSKDQVEDASAGTPAA